MPSSRKFKLVRIGRKNVDAGEYTGTPSSAATKAFNRHCSENKLKVCASTEIVVEEIGGKGKQFTYTGVRELRDKPLVRKDIVDKNGDPVEYKYETKVRAKK